MAKTFTPSFYHKSVILQRRRSKCENQTLSTPLRASVRRFAAFCARRRCRRRRKGESTQKRAGVSVRALARSRIMRARESRLRVGRDASELRGGFMRVGEWAKRERKSAADAALFRECVRAVLRRAFCAPCALLLRSRHPGNRGRSNTPWHTSCENSVQGGILQ